MDSNLPTLLTTQERTVDRFSRGAQAGLRGDRALGAAGDLGGPADPLADPVVGADRQLVLAQQRPGRVDRRAPRCSTSRAVGGPDPARAPPAQSASGDRDQLRAGGVPTPTISQAGSPLSAST